MEPGPLEEFSLPEDITALNDEELDAFLEGAVRAFDSKAGSTTVTSDDLTQLRELATAVENIRAERVERIEAAEKAAAEGEDRRLRTRRRPRAARRRAGRARRCRAGRRARSRQGAGHRRCGAQGPRPGPVPVRVHQRAFPEPDVVPIEASVPVAATCA